MRVDRQRRSNQFQQSQYLDRGRFAARIDADYRSKAALIPALKLPE